MAWDGKVLPGEFQTPGKTILCRYLNLRIFFPFSAHHPFFLNT